MALSNNFTQLLRPFEEVWIKSLITRSQIDKKAAATANTDISSISNNNTITANNWQNNPALANMTPQQLAALGLNASQLEYARSMIPSPSNSNGTINSGLGLAANNNPSMVNKSNSATSLRSQTGEPSMEQLSEARSVVARLRSEVETSRREFFSSFLYRLEGYYTDPFTLYQASLKLIHVADEDKSKVAILTHELLPLAKRVSELLPLFLAMCNDQLATRKILTMVRYLFFRVLISLTKT